MADTKISALSQLSVAPSPTDEFVMVDKSDTTMAASGTDVRIQWQNMGQPLGTWFPCAPAPSFASATATANRMYYTQIVIPTLATITGLTMVCVNSTGNVRSALYDSTGARVANKTANVASNSTFLKIPFDSSYIAVPGVYFGGIVFSSSSGTYQGGLTMAPGNAVDVGAFTTAAGPVSVPTTVAAFTIPIMTTY